MPKSVEIFWHLTIMIVFEVYLLFRFCGYERSFLKSFFSYQCHFFLAQILHWVFDLDRLFVARQSAKCFFARVPGEDFLPKVLD